MKPQRINQKSNKKSPTLIDNRSYQIDESIPENVDPKTVRTVNYVEVNEMDGKQVQLLIQELNKISQTAKGGIHYFVPIRKGVITTDVIFEEEWLNVVKETCEVNENGGIVLKNGAQELHVIRRKI